MKLQCKEVQCETDKFKAGRAYETTPQGPMYMKLVDDNGHGWLVSLSNLKVNINGKEGDEARFALFRKSHA